MANTYDPHTMLAAELFNVPITEVTAEQRSYAKKYAYRRAYSFGAVPFAADLRRSATNKLGK